MQHEWERYSCQIALPGFGKESQQKLQNAKVLIAGAGGLGCPAAQYLAASGIGRIGIADFDVILVSNLHRQVLYSPSEVGFLKAEIACKKLQHQNLQISLVPIIKKITVENVLDIIGEYDIVVDGTDNFETKYILNDACVLTGKPFVYAGIYQLEGQISVLNVLNADGTYSPNYRDLFPDINASQIPDCADGGMMPTIAGIIGCMQANEVIKWITGTGELLAGKILIIDATTLQSRIIKTGMATKAAIIVLPQTSSANLISIAELKKNLNTGLYELIDVRNADERIGYHIGGKHIPLEELENKYSLIDTNRPVVFYCAAGKRSAEAVKMMAKKFHKKVFFSLDGGVEAWLTSNAITLENI